MDSKQIEQSEVEKTKIINYINVFRAFAILLIVLAHTFRIYFSNPKLHLLNAEIVCNGTALFVFISGFLFQHLSHKFEYKKYLLKKWYNVIMPYLIMSIPGLIFCFIFPKIYLNPFDGLAIWKQMPVLLTSGSSHNPPMWFIPMIVLFFLSSGIMLYLEKKNVLYKFLPVLFILTIVFPRVDILAEILKCNSYTDKYISANLCTLRVFLHFISIYVFGMFCSKYKNIIDTFYNNRYLFLILMVCVSALSIYSASKYAYYNGSLSKIFLTILVLCYLKHYDNWFISHVHINKCFDVLAKYSFGIFFIHWYILWGINRLFHLEGELPYKGINTIIIVSARFLLVTVISLIVLYICRKLLLLVNKDIKTRSIIGV